MESDAEKALIETDAQIKFEFGAEHSNDEPSPKTPEFSEIADTKLDNTIM